MNVAALGNGRYLVVSDARRTLAYAVRQRDETWIFIDGRVFLVATAETAAGPRGGVRDDAALSAPMPATVVAINVVPGQTVKAGDLLVTLEAMKMELSIAAPSAATVQAVHCRIGELVQPGFPLVALVTPKPAGEGE